MAVGLFVERLALQGRLRPPGLDIDELGVAVFRRLGYLGRFEALLERRQGGQAAFGFRQLPAVDLHNAAGREIVSDGMVNRIGQCAIGKE